MTGPAPMCLYCKHYRTSLGDPSTEERYVCTAFPDGIPDEIIDFEFDHREPHPDDNGIQFALASGYDELPDYVLDLLAAT